MPFINGKQSPDEEDVQSELLIEQSYFSTY